MTTHSTLNPHPEFSRAWIEWEDAYFRELIATGGMADLMDLVAADARRDRERDA